MRVIWTSWAHVWRLRSLFLGTGYDSPPCTLLWQRAARSLALGRKRFSVRVLLSWELRKEDGPWGILTAVTDYGRVTKLCRSTENGGGGRSFSLWQYLGHVGGEVGQGGAAGSIGEGGAPLYRAEGGTRWAIRGNPIGRRWWGLNASVPWSRRGTRRGNGGRGTGVAKRGGSVQLLARRRDASGWCSVHRWLESVVAAAVWGARLRGLGRFSESSRQLTLPRLGRTGRLGPNGRVSWVTDGLAWRESK
jgi:hypothetical protein